MALIFMKFYFDLVKKTVTYLSFCSNFNCLRFCLVWFTFYIYNSKCIYPFFFDQFGSPLLGVTDLVTKSQPIGTFSTETQTFLERKCHEALKLMLPSRLSSRQPKYMVKNAVVISFSNFVPGQRLSHLHYTSDSHTLLVNRRLSHGQHVLIISKTFCSTLLVKFFLQANSEPHNPTTPSIHPGHCTQTP